MPKKSIDYKARAAFVRKFVSLPFNNRTKFTAQQKRAITNTWKKYRRYRGIREKKVGGKLRAELKRRGFITTKTGVLVDDFRDGFGDKIEGSTVTILASGIIKVSLNKPGAAAKRDDYIYNFTEGEKIEFLSDPEGFIERLIARIPVLKRNFDPRILRTKPARQQIKFVINGSFSSYKNITLDALEFYIEDQADPEKFSEVITGIRLIKYTPKKKKPGVKKKHAAKKKVSRRTRRRN